MTHPRSHDESKPNPGLSLNRGLFLEPPKLHSLHSRHNPNFAIHCPPKQPAHSAPSRAGERWSLEQHFGQGCFNVPSTPTPAANNNFFPQSLTHPPVSGSRLPAVSLSSKRSPCLDVPGRDRLGVEMKGNEGKEEKIPNTAVSGRVSFEPSFLVSSGNPKSFHSASLSPAAAEQPWGRGVGVLRGHRSPSPQER